MTGIYAIRNLVNNKYYIGQAKDIKERWMQHRSRLKCGTHENSHLQASYNKYQKDNFEYIVVEECDVENLNEREIYYIEKYDSYNNGYNQDKGGAGCTGYKHTEEELRKMRQIQNPEAVLQLDKNLNIIAEYDSSSHASKCLGYPTRRCIDSVCKRINNQKSYKGYIWVYKNEYYSNLIDWSYYLEIKEKNAKRISQYDLNMQLVNVWESVNSLCTKHKYSASQILKNCNFKSKTAYNYIWRFTDTYTDEQYKLDCSTKFNPTPDKKSKKVAQYDMDMNLICVWDSLKQIEKQTGWGRSSISACCRENSSNSHGYIWRFISDDLVSQ